VTCPDDQVRYQARNYVGVPGGTMDVWEVRCLPATAEVGQLLAIGFLIPEDAEGKFPDPVSIPTRCCGQAVG